VPKYEPFGYISAQLTDGIRRALQDGDMESVVGLLKMLALTAPVQAQAVWDTIEAGLMIAGQGRVG